MEKRLVIASLATSWPVKATAGHPLNIGISRSDGLEVSLAFQLSEVTMGL